MAGSNKILTVSYGTFSCTLEGFEDSFETMKAIAEYFRDLAADDRYFGAEPAKPDAEMMARIAEREIARQHDAREIARQNDAREGARQNDAREIARRVEAQSDARGITLRRTAEPAVEPDPARAPEPAAAAAPGAEAVRTAGDAPAPRWAAGAGADRRAASPLDEFEADEEEDALLPAAAPPRPAPARPAPDRPALPRTASGDAGTGTPAAPDFPAPAEVESVAAKLQRIRAAVGRAAPLAPLWVGEPAPGLAALTATPARQDADAPQADSQTPEAAAEDGTPGGEAATVAALHAAPDADSMDGPEAEAAGPAHLSDLPTDPVEADAAPDDVAGLAVADGTNADGDEPAEYLADADAEQDEAAALSMLDAADVEWDWPVDHAAMDDADADAERDGPLDLAATDDADLEPGDAEDVASLEDDGYEDEIAESVLAALGPQPQDLAGQEGLSGPGAGGDANWLSGDDDAPEEEARDQDQPAACALDEEAVTEGATAGAAADGDEDAEDEQARRPDEEAEATEAEAALADDREADHGQAAGEDRQAGAVGGEDESAEDAAEDCADSDQDREDARAEDRAEDEPEDRAEDGADRDDDRAEDRAEDEDGTEDGDGRDAEGGPLPSARSGRALLHGQPEADEAALSRILSETDAHLQEPEGSRRRQAIAQLKAAVAATEAARRMGERPDDGSKADKAFRNDLRQVVRPRRPQLSPAEPRSERPRSIPLKLVASQRVDETPPATPVTPVRPRRIANPAAEAVPGDSDSFASFAARMKAKDLPDLLEAAAAHAAFVEGAEDFSRPQIMKKVRQMLSEDFSREDGLRIFGTLLRQGRITKVRNGRFQVSEQTRFNPERRAG